MTIALLVVKILFEIFQVVTEGKNYLFDLEKDFVLNFENILDLIGYLLVTICQFYYWTSGKVVNGYYSPNYYSYFEGYFFFMILALHLNLILQYSIAFSITRRYVIMIL